MISIPYTHYHLGPSGLVGLLFLKWIDYPTLLIGSVILDIEGISVLFFDLSYPLHGYLHSFYGAFLAALILILVMMVLRKYFSPIMAIFRVKQDVTVRSISIGAFLGTFSHVILDAMLYGEMNPFFPLTGNPFLIESSYTRFYMLTFCTFCALGALLTYFIKLTIQISKDKKRKKNL